MTQLAYSATALERVTSLTNIQPDDSKIVAASKFAGGLPLKVSIAALATFEFVLRTAGLIATSPLYFFANKTFTEMTDSTKSAAKTIVDATAALARIHAEEKKSGTPALLAPKTIRDHLNDALAYAQEKGNATLAAIQKNPKTTAAALAGALTLIALYYSYPSILSHFHRAAAFGKLETPNSQDPILSPKTQLPLQKH